MTNGADYVQNVAGVVETRDATNTEVIHHITPNPSFIYVSV